VGSAVGGVLGGIVGGAVGGALGGIVVGAVGSVGRALGGTGGWKFPYSTLNCKVTAKILNFFIRVDNNF
jgi:outer membrane lipoprotein SlyB